MLSGASGELAGGKQWVEVHSRVGEGGPVHRSHVTGQIFGQRRAIFFFNDASGL